MGIFAATGLLALGTAPTAFGKNAGDVWTDNVGQPSGPGHEHDPHLACQDINLWGSDLAEPSGTYVIDGWPPSGSQEQDYPAAAGSTSKWSYNQSLGGSQVISVINVKTLIETAIAHGDAPVNGQGYHFKLQFSQDPQKHKTFWVKCPAPAPKEGGGGTEKEGKEGGGGKEKEGKEGGGNNPPPGTTNPPPGTTNTPAGGTNPPAGSPSGTPAGNPPKSAVKGTHKSIKHHHKLVHAKRHLKPHKRHVSGARNAAPQFTG
jgi:hypothetical protein